jgi:two-component system CheB/CheR fusion protein
LAATDAGIAGVLGLQMNNLGANSPDRRPDDIRANRIGSDELSRLAEFSLDQAVDPVFWIDSDGKIMYANQAACISLEYSPEEMKRLSVHDLDPLFPKESWAPHWEEVRQRRSFVFESVHRTKSGKTYPVEIAVNCLTLGNKEYNCVFARNISERKETERVLRESEERYRSLVEHISMGITLMDRNHRIITINRVHADMIGRLPEHCVGQECFRVFEKRTVICPHCPGTRAMATGMPAEVETTGIRDDGTRYAARVQAFPVFNPDMTTNGFIEVVEDISNHKRAEQELTKAKLAAEASARAKGEFLANMSHEIRTPMTAILGFADILLASPSPREAAEAAKIIKRNGEHLLSIINDLLDLSRIESGKQRIEELPCSPSQIVADVIATMKVTADAKGLFLTSETVGAVPDIIRTDPIRLRQILVNLVGNAVKFTEVGGVRIVMQLEAAATSDPKLRCDVVDTGIGLSAEDVQRVFEPFSQADGSTKRRFGGTGLGLAISQRLAKILGGDIVASGIQGKGSTFTLTVGIGPQGLAESGPSVAAVGVRTKGSRCDVRLGGRILLAEDGPDNQRLIRHVLQKAGAEVVVADHGQIAVELARTAMESGCRYDAVIMDIQMPVMDGYEATGRLRSLGYTGPIIALTAHAMLEDRQKCLDAGCDEYTTKPIDREELLRLLAKYVGKRPDLQSAKSATA